MEALEPFDFSPLGVHISSVFSGSAFSIGLVGSGNELGSSLDQQYKRLSNEHRVVELSELKYEGGSETRFRTRMLKGFA